MFCLVVKTGTKSRRQGKTTKVTWHMSKWAEIALCALVALSSFPVHPCTCKHTKTVSEGPCSCCQSKDPANRRNSVTCCENNAEKRCPSKDSRHPSSISSGHMPRQTWFCGCALTQNAPLATPEEMKSERLPASAFQLQDDGAIPFLANVCGMITHPPNAPPSQYREDLPLIC